MNLLLSRSFLLLLLGVVWGLGEDENGLGDPLLQNHRFRPSAVDPGPRKIRFPVYDGEGEKRRNETKEIEKNEISAESSQKSPRAAGVPPFSPQGSGVGRSGWGHCRELSIFNEGCCFQGYSNCCGGKPVIQPQPLPPQHHQGWGHGQGHHHVHQPQFPPPIFHKPFKPFPPKPHPPVHHPVRPFPPVHGGGWPKPGSCVYKSLSFLSKLNPFSYFGKGWGWDPHPPSHNAGYHFYRRSDQGENPDPENTNRLTRTRQLNLSPQYQPQSQLQHQSQFHPQVPHQGQGQQQYPYINPRILGWKGGITSGWGVVHPSPCSSDFQCPGHEKCCGGICKVPNLSIL